MRVFIVHCHPEPLSFNKALTDAGVAALEQAGHTVRVSDLWAQGWDPYNDRRSYKTVGDPSVFRQQVEEAYASKHDGFVDEIKEEQEKLEWCDVLILQFPLHWFGLPAMAKSWVDKVFAYQKLYGGTAGWYDKSKFKGKRAMLSVTTGSPASMYGLEGLNGHIEVILFPINHGILFYAGFTPVEPFICYGVARVSDRERQAMLERYKERVLTIATMAPLPYLGLDHYDASRGWVRKPSLGGDTEEDDEDGDQQHDRRLQYTQQHHHQQVQQPPPQTVYHLPPPHLPKQVHQPPPRQGTPAQPPMPQAHPPQAVYKC